MSKYTLGLDFGTESARAMLVDVATGETVATAVHPYADGVIDETLPGSDESLPPDWALQNPADWLAALDVTIPVVLAEGGIAPESIVGLGLDFTACTILPTKADGTPPPVASTSIGNSPLCGQARSPHLSVTIRRFADSQGVDSSASWT